MCARTRVGAHVWVRVRGEEKSKGGGVREWLVLPMRFLSL